MLKSQRFHLGCIVEQVVKPQIGYGMRPFRPPVETPTFVGDGEHLATASEWRVISGPGHTDDSTLYYHESMKTLASGDAVLTHAGRAWFNPEYVDAELSAETEDKLRSLRVDVLLPGHGRPLVGHDLLANARSFTES